jgi:RNAse (barnase) inhibitor barstar
MKIIRLNASKWSSTDDFYDALLKELGSPGWHGHNLDALWDSIAGGSINQVEPPFSVIVEHANPLSEEMAALFQGVSKVFTDARSEHDLEVWFSVG